MNENKDLNILQLMQDISKDNYSVLKDKDRMARYMKIELFDTDEGESITFGNLVEGALKIAKRDHNVHSLMKQDIRTAGMYFLGVLGVYAKLYLNESHESDQRIVTYFYAFKSKTTEELDEVRDHFILGQIDMDDTEILGEEDLVTFVNQTH